jgi:hypothetical protein
MYSTCLFCSGPLGANEVIGHFPVGRRLAFDAAKGRLWVVCRKCERWNLTPLEERWEATEECERLFARTRLRVSTENIGLARVAEGLELVRIGGALRPEFAGWRYGDQFGRRRRRHLVASGAAGVAVAGFLIVGPATGFFAGGGWGLWNLASSIHSFYQGRRVRVRLPVSGRAAPLVVRKAHLAKASLVTAVGADWELRVSHDRPGGARVADATWYTYDDRSDVTVFRGDDALRASRLLLPQVNAKGARASEVQNAVRLIEQVPESGRLFARYASRLPTHFGGAGAGAPGTPIQGLPTEVRLALEMAAHEEVERRAFEGELALLEESWREAEEIAAIADDLLVPSETLERLELLKRR